MSEVSVGGALLAGIAAGALMMRSQKGWVELTGLCILAPCAALLLALVLMWSGALESWRVSP